MKIVFATNNQHKLEEIKNLLGNHFDILSLKDIDFHEEIPEDHETLEENALQKANHIYKLYKIPCFADDTGLEIEALNGDPGVYSARYAGPQKSAEDNMNKVIKELIDVDNRNARFRSVIALIIDDKEYLFEGIVNGQMLREKKGVKGFGYDPIFKPNTYDVSFAEMGMDEKNKISHRGLAVQKLVEFLKKYTS